MFSFLIPYSLFDRIHSIPYLTRIQNKEWNNYFCCSHARSVGSFRRMPSVASGFAEYQFTECKFTERRFAKCQIPKCRFTNVNSLCADSPNTHSPNVYSLNVVSPHCNSPNANMLNKE